MTVIWEVAEGRATAGGQCDIHTRRAYVVACTLKAARALAPWCPQCVTQTGTAASLQQEHHFQQVLGIAPVMLKGVYFIQLGAQSWKRNGLAVTTLDYPQPQRT